MFKQLLDLTAKLFFLARDVQENKTDIQDIKQKIGGLQDDMKDLQREVQELARGLERLAYEIRRVSDTDAHERKVLSLQLENDMLKFERRLPNPKDKEE